LIKAGGRIIRREIQTHIMSITNKEELPEEWKESITVPIYKKGDNIDYSNYRGISRLPNTYQILSNILLSMLTAYVEEIIGDHKFRRKISTAGHILCIRQIFVTQRESVHQLFIDFTNAYD